MQWNSISLRYCSSIYAVFIGFSRLPNKVQPWESLLYWDEPLLAPNKRAHITSHVVVFSQNPEVTETLPPPEEAGDSPGLGLSCICILSTKFMKFMRRRYLESSLPPNQSNQTSVLCRPFCSVALLKPQNAILRRLGLYYAGLYYAGLYSNTYEVHL